MIKTDHVWVALMQSWRNKYHAENPLGVDHNTL